MAASQRVSSGFHRLGLLLAAIPMLTGAVWADDAAAVMQAALKWTF